MMTQEFPMPPMEGPLVNRGIHPISLNAVRKIHETDLHQVQKITHGYEETCYRPVRNATNLLVPGNDYAELPGYKGQTPTALLQGLPAGARILDVGCSDGSFAHEIVKTINQDVRAYGFDARAADGQEVNLTQVAIGNVYDLNRQHFGGVDFDLVLSSALVYHLNDPLLGMLRMAEMVKNNGLLLLSTVPRIINTNTNRWTETEQSLIPSHNVDYRYYGGHNIYDPQGRLTPSRELTSLLGKKLGFDMEYAFATVPNSGGMTFGGQISGKKLHAPDGSIRFYYCKTDGDELPHIWKDTLGYIITTTEQESQALHKLGYAEVPSGRT